MTCSKLQDPKSLQARKIVFCSIFCIFNFNLENTIKLLVFRKLVRQNFRKQIRAISAVQNITYYQLHLKDTIKDCGVNVGRIESLRS